MQILPEQVMCVPPKFLVPTEARKDRKRKLRCHSVTSPETRDEKFLHQITPGAFFWTRREIASARTDKITPEETSEFLRCSCIFLIGPTIRYELLSCPAGPALHACVRSLYRFVLKEARKIDEAPIKLPIKP